MVECGTTHFLLRTGMNYYIYKKKKRMEKTKQRTTSFYFKEKHIKLTVKGYDNHHAFLEAGLLSKARRGKSAQPVHLLGRGGLQKLFATPYSFQIS